MPREAYAPGLSVRPGSNATIHDIAFESPQALGVDASGAGTSSIAALVDTSDVTFVRAILTAGPGFAGTLGLTARLLTHDPDPRSGNDVYEISYGGVNR